MRYGTAEINKPVRAEWRMSASPCAEGREPLTGFRSIRRRNGVLVFVADLIALAVLFGCLRLVVPDAPASAWSVLTGEVSTSPIGRLWGPVLLLALLPLFLMRLGHYGVRVPFAMAVRHILLAIMALTVVHTYAQTLILSAPVGLWDIVIWPVAFAALTSCRFLASWILHRLGLWLSPVVVVAPEGMLEPICRLLEKTATIGYAPTRFVTMGGAVPGEVVAQIARLHCEGTIDHAVIATDAAHAEQTRDIVLQLEAVCDVPYSIIPEFGPLPFLRFRLGPLLTKDTIVFNKFGGYHRSVAPLGKRVFDVTAAFMLMVMMAPLLVLVTVAVMLDGGQPFYGSPRVGRHGRVFRAWKFRTMVLDADQVLQRAFISNPDLRAEWERGFKLENDPRITRIGRFLRSTSLDELPQLWNVISGTMSLVGPRPILLGERASYGDDLALYTRVRPGVTGLWQINGRNDLEYKRRVDLNSWYAKNWSLWGDLVVLAQTVPAVLRRTGAG